MQLRRASLPPSALSRGRQLPGWLAPLVAFAILGGLGWWWFGDRFRPSTAVAPPVESAPVDDEVARRERAQRVCEATRSRVMRGTTVGPLDVEGWVVELMLLRSGSEPLATDPGLSEFIAREPNAGAARVSWPRAPDISALDGIDTTARLEEEALRPPDADAGRLLRVTFGGRYVLPYFRKDQRVQYVMLANALSARVKADYGALFARCESSESRHIAVWFLGATPGAALTSLLYFMGTDNDSPQLAPAVMLDDAGVFERDAVLARIASATKAASKSEVATWVGTQGGMISAPADGPTRITFPYRDSNRASRASREIARQLGIGVAR